VPTGNQQEAADIASGADAQRAAPEPDARLQPHPIPASPSTPSPPRRPPAPAPSPTSLDRPFLTNQPDVITVTFVRHGQQEVPGQTFTPALWTDAPLSARGKRQAATVGGALAGEKIDAVACSHLQRARETAQQVADRHGLEPVVYPELREVETYRDVPDGVALEDVLSPAIWLGVQERFLRERRWDVSPFSEGSAEFRHRIVTVVEGILALCARDGVQHVAIVCHGGVINAYIGHILGIQEDMFFRPAHASISRVLSGDGRRVVHTLNEMHHLAAADPDLVTF
jgi:2,3-bisphosphoglycerate-dependent phosphoglycerate mutase